MTGHFAVGCSGWSYADWRGVVYPADVPRSRWFEHYTTLFDTVELNNTFYRLPKEATVVKWAESAPARLPVLREARRIRFAPNEAS